MRVPANINMPLEEYLCKLRDPTFVPKVDDLPLLKKAKAVFNNELVGED